MELLLLLMLAIPLAGCLINGLVLRAFDARTTGTVATVATTLSFVLAVVLGFHLLKTDIPISVQFTWVETKLFTLQWGFIFDPLTAIMTMVVAGIGAVIHLYSIGYMAEDATPSRYFAYLNLFIFSMLVLVTADNLPVLFVGWEGVGLCSYLLIGYWYEDIQKSAAGMKAFIVNRIGDAGFLIGIFFCFQLLGSLNFIEMEQTLSQTQDLNRTIVNLAALFLFIGAVGKSAQIPLFVWLPDAMAGPTPVSALIHAATMVTAGVYMVARMGFLYQLAIPTSQLIALVGALTAFMAGTIALAQRDIKKVLAYSTVSQLGFMFLACGMGAYFAAIFHLMTHAFFKALLFLGAGSIIHGLGGEQDITQMGGLRRQLPKTFVTFSVAVLAIAGIPPLAGFFSKDTILFATLTSNQANLPLWILATLTSLLTALYMGRLYFLVFFGSYRGSAHPHESPWVMTIPLILLAAGSVVAGFVGVPHGLHLIPNYMGDFLSPVLTPFVENPPLLSEHMAMAIAIGVGLVGLALALFLYLPSASRAERMAQALRPIHLLLKNKYWVDELYRFMFVRPYEWVCQVMATVVDQQIIDRLVVLPSRVCRASSTALSLFHNGSVQFYLWIMLVGALIVTWVSLEGFLL